jgi:hypothetical protein
MAQQQQTVLRVQFNSASGLTYHNLDLNSSIPIKVTRSFAELQDISTKNSDTALNLKLPGSKANNRFFENFFDVDSQSLYFNAIKKVNCDVLIDYQPYFTGYMILNSVAVQNSAIEYDVSLYSTVGTLFADIGNKLLIDLNFDDPQYTFNHTFNLNTVTQNWNYSNFTFNQEEPLTYIYPVVHNGYLYTGNTVNVSGGTAYSQSRLYTSSPIKAGAYANTAAALADGVKPYRINTPGQGIFDNQLKPALSVWNLVQLIFKTYGYTIKSDFMNTPWMKTLYMYGYFNSTLTKFSTILPGTAVVTYPPEGCKVIVLPTTDLTSFDLIVVQAGTGIPALCSSDISVDIEIKIRYHGFLGFQFNAYETYNYKIAKNTTGTTVNLCQSECPWTPDPFSSFQVVYRHYQNKIYSSVGFMDVSSLKYLPTNPNEPINIIDGDAVNFSQIIDPIFKQIDFLSSLAKKFNLVFTPDPDVPNQIIIESYSYYVGTGDVHDWTDKLSFDQGFKVEPALNYVDSYMVFTDAEDNDEGNRIFKNRNNRLYGQKNVANSTDFKSTTGKTETTFGAQIFRVWDSQNPIDGQLPNANIQLPLGLNYAGTTNITTTGADQVTNYLYQGVKTKPKLFWNLIGGNVLNEYSDTGTTYNFNPTSYSATTYTVWVATSSGSTWTGYENIPIISNNMPIGIQDQYKINNDNLSILFNAEPSSDLDVNTFTTYTNNDAYQNFYFNRVQNVLYNPNTRFLSGKFWIKPNEYKNLKANDIIKIRDQYFTWNKIVNYNLTNSELTEVELVQYNNLVNEFPTRYFKYTYCDHPEYSFRLSTDFTNPNLLYTNFGWSVYYDHSCGQIFGSNQPTGFTSTLTYFVDFNTYYVPYTIQEITETEYNSIGLDYTDDTLMMHIYNLYKAPFGDCMPTYWYGGSPSLNKTGLNLFKNCSTFASIAAREHIRIGSSIYYGEPAYHIINTELSQNINTEENNNIQTNQ